MQTLSYYGTELEALKRQRASATELLHSAVCEDNPSNDYCVHARRDATEWVHMTAWRIAMGHSVVDFTPGILGVFQGVVLTATSNIVVFVLIFVGVFGWSGLNIKHVFAASHTDYMHDSAPDTRGGGGVMVMMPRALARQIEENLPISWRPRSQKALASSHSAGYSDV
jgi:hypothetical protein